VGVFQKKPFTFRNIIESLIQGALTAGLAVVFGGWTYVILSLFAAWFVFFVTENIANAATWTDVWNGFLAIFSRVAPQTGWNTRDLTVPEDMICPISQQLFVDPVVALGDVFERVSLERWVTEQGNHPLSRLRLSLGQIRPCPRMKALVIEYVRMFQITPVPQVQA